jgi:hypothetical protein
MTGQSQRQIVFNNAATIVPNFNQPDAALLYLYMDVAGSGIKTIFDQLLNYRGRPFDNFTRSNLVNQLGR